MNVTEFKAFILPNLKVKAEINRLNNLTKNDFKYYIGRVFKEFFDQERINFEDITEKNAKMVWHHINILKARQAKKDRIATRNFTVQNAQVRKRRSSNWAPEEDRDFGYPNEFWK